MFKSNFFFFNDTATTEIYTLSLHDALPISTASAFLLLVGSSLAISYSRAGARQGLFGKYLRRGLRIFAYGMALTVVLYVLGVGIVAFGIDRKSTRLNSSHANISYAVFCLKKKKIKHDRFL